MPNALYILTRTTLLAAALVLPAPAEAKGEGAAALAMMRSARARMGLDPGDDFTIKDLVRDGLGQVHVRLQQTHKGLPVWGGQAIVHLDPGKEGEPLTDALVRHVGIETTPNLQAAEALAVAQNRVVPVGDYTELPGAELVIWPERTAPADPGGDPVVLANHLAYHVHLELENGKVETRHEDLMVDAHTGAVLKAWSTLLTARRGRSPAPLPGEPATGIGNSLYSGQVLLDTTLTPAGYELRDPTRGGFSTRDLGGGHLGHGAPYLSPDPSWGDGRNYDPGLGTVSRNGQTAAVDAHYGMQVAWDFFRNVLGRDGIDGKGTGPINLVHYAVGFDNAFWSDGCFCMTYGDGLMSKSLTSLEVVGHEVSHGLCSATAGLGYDGEAGALNEANSDILGILIRFYGKGAKGRGDRVPDQGAAWTVGEDLFDQPIRYLIKPSQDGASLDEWSPDLWREDVHLSSGPMNRAFYFLAQGSSGVPGAMDYSPRLRGGMKGIGNQKALQIWWRTLSTRLTPASGYQQARRGALQSARELFGRNSAEEYAVASAFKAVNVGKKAR